MERALSHLRICDFTGQLAGAGATRFLAAFGAQVIRIEDPTSEGRWDILRGMSPYVDERRGGEFGGPFNNHNVEKLGITLNLKTERGKELLRELIAKSDVVSENFAAGVLARFGFTYEDMRAIKPDIVYVSNCGFGHTGPYRTYKTWGPMVQAVSGLTFASGLPGMPPAGWGYSFMDHTGGYFMAIAILMALKHRNRTGEGQWVDMSCTEAGATLHGPAILDYTVNGRAMRREGMPHSNHNQWPGMAPHNIYPAKEPDTWVAISCRNDGDWTAIADVIGEEWARDGRYESRDGRLGHQDELDEQMATWTRRFDPFEVSGLLRGVGVPAAPVQTPQQRIDQDPNTANWGLWPTVHHTLMGDVRVDGLPVHLSETDWEMTRGAPLLGEHNDLVYGDLLGLEAEEIERLKTEGVL